jgi:hypothetical protein
MIIESRGTATQVEGAEAPAVQFQIAASAHSFAILSQNLYNDRIQAIIRELACNAHDSHIMSDKADTPMSIHLPTIWEPYFSLRDFGTGLSNEDVTGLYCTYFNSTKSQDQNLTGAFGLGSKSPFAYTSGFTVKSYFNQTLSIFDAHISESGLPNIVLLESQPTEEPNGLEVKFPVAKNDIAEFMNKAAIALEFITPRPALNREFNIVSQDYVVKTESWGIRRKEYTAQSTTLRAVQGMVAYAVGNIDLSKMNDTHKLIVGLPIDLFFNIGQLAVAPSREYLSNDTRTVQNLLDRLEEVYQSMLDEVKIKLYGCNTAWEARLMLANLANSTMGTIVRRGMKDNEFFGQYPNFLLSDEKPALNELDYTHATVVEFERSYARVRADKTFVFPQRTIEERIALRGQAVIDGTVATEHRVEFTPDTQTLFVVNDLALGGERVVHVLVQNQQRYKKVYLITRAEAISDPAKVLEEAADMLVKLGAPKSRLASDLEAEFPDLRKSLTEAKARTTWKRRNIMKLIRNTDDGCSFWKNWVRVDDESTVPDATTPKYYLVLNDCKPTFRQFTNCQGMLDYVGICVNSGLIPGLNSRETIYGLKADSKLIGEPDWIELSGALEKSVRDYFTPERQLALSGVFNYTDRSDLPQTLLDDIVKHEAFFSASSPISLFAKKVSVLEESLDNRIHVRAALAEILDTTDFKYTHFFPNLSKEWKELTRQYPLLQTSSFSTYTRRVVLDDFIQYLILKDSQRAVAALAEKKEEAA